MSKLTAPIQRRSLLAMMGAYSSYLLMEKLLGSTARANTAPLKAPQAARLIIVYHPDGAFLDQWHPTQTSGPVLAWPESIAPLAPYREQLLLLRNLSLLDGQGDGHDEAARMLLTGARDPSLGSLDLHVADYLRQTLLHVGVLASKSQGHSVSFSPGGAERVADDSPLAVYKRLFAEQLTATLDPQVMREVEQQLLIFIATLDDARQKLKLEQHLKQLRILGEAKNQCAAYDLSLFPYEESLKWEDKAAPLVLKMQITNLVEALACSLSRVATLQVSRHTSPMKMDFDWLKRWNGSEAMESHQASHNSGAIHAQQKKWINQQLTHLFRLLDERPEPLPGRSGSMLDHTLICVVTEIAQGASHTRKDMPFYVMGGAGLEGYETGRVLDCAGASHAQLLWSLAQAMGVPPQGGYAGAGALKGLFS